MKRTAVYCGTRNLYSDMITAAKSLLIHSNVEEIYFLIEDDTFPYKLPPYIKTINISNQSYFVSNGPNYNSPWTYMVLIRSTLSKIFPDLDTVLSLDVDTIVNENISDLWDLDLSDYYLAAAKEPCKCINDFISINMGVVLFNLKRMRKIDDAIIYSLNHKYYDYNEQDCISEFCQGGILELSPDYNISNWVELEAARHRKIMHFAAVKDWQNNPLVKKYAAISFDEIQHNIHDEIKLDIIIPVYDDAEGLARTLESVYYDEHSDWINITIVDDCSNEDYSDVLNKYSRIRYIGLLENRGPGAARNIGMQFTVNPYIMFVDCGDIIFSKWSLYEIKDVITHNTMADLYQWPWINGEWNTINIANSVCTPGMVYKREFLNLYNIRYAEDKIGSYSNEDIGFNRTCKTILRHIRTYDSSIHYIYNETPIYKMIYRTESLTHKDGNTYLFTKQIPGTAINAAHSIKQCKSNNIDIRVLLTELNDFLMVLYKYYLYCAKNRPDLVEQNLPYIKDFYINVYTKYRDNPYNELYFRRALGRRMKDFMLLTDKPNVRKFFAQFNS